MTYPGLNVVDNTLRFALQLRAQFLYMSINHALVDFEPAAFGIKLQEAPANLTSGKTFINLRFFVV